MISVKKVLEKSAESGTVNLVNLKSLVAKPLFVPESASVLKLLELFKETGVDIALITDEYGSIQGVITLHDILRRLWVKSVPLVSQWKHKLMFGKMVPG